MTHSTVSLTRYFDDSEKTSAPVGVVGIRGTGWFLAPTLVVTVEHVASAMNLSQTSWHQIAIAQPESTGFVSARIQQVAGSSSERLAVLELQTAFPGAAGFPMRIEPLGLDEAVVSLAYPDGHPRTARGRFVEYPQDERLAGAALFELYDGNDRMVLDHGSSGAPIFDCSGRVVAAVASLFTTTLQFMSAAKRISTPWGSANVMSVPIPVMIPVMEGFSKID